MLSPPLSNPNLYFISFLTAFARKHATLIPASLTFLNQYYLWLQCNGDEDTMVAVLTPPNQRTKDQEQAMLLHFWSPEEDRILVERDERETEELRQLRTRLAVDWRKMFLAGTGLPQRIIPGGMQ